MRGEQKAEATTACRRAVAQRTDCLLTPRSHSRRVPGSGTRSMDGVRCKVLVIVMTDTSFAGAESEYMSRATSFLEHFHTF